MSNTHGSSSANPDRPARTPQGKPSLRQRFFGSIYRLVRYRAWWVLFVSLFLSMLALYSIRDLPIKESMLDLLPKNDPLIEQFKRRLPEIQQSDLLVILLQLEQAPVDLEEGIQRLQPVADQTVLRLLLHPQILSADYRLDPKIVAFQKLATDQSQLEQIQSAIGALQQGSQDLPSLLTQKDFAKQYEDIAGQIVDLFQTLSEGQKFETGLVTELFDTLQSYNAQLIQALGQLQPQLTQTQETIDKLLHILHGLEQELNKTVLDISPDGRSLRIVAQPSQPSYVSLNFNKQIVQIAQQTLDALLPPAGGIKPYVAGSYSFTAESNRALQLDMFYTTLISIAGIMLVFLLTYRGILYPMLIIIPLSMATVWMTAWAKYVFGGFNLVTSLLPALILGVGINYGIFFLGRFFEARQEGKGLNAALHETILHKGDALLTSAMTTGIVFFILMMSQAQGLYEMGLVAGFGVLACVMLTLFVLPALIVVSHLALRRQLRRPAGYRWGLSWLVRWVMRGRWAVILLFVLATGSLLGPASTVRIQFVSTELMVSGLPTQIARQVIVEAGFPEEAGDFFLFFLPSQDKAQRLEETLRSMHLVVDVRSVRDYWAQTAALQNLDLDQPFQQGESLITNLLSSLGNKAVLSEQLGQMGNELRYWKERATPYGLHDVVELLNGLITQLVDIESGLNRMDLNQLQSQLIQLQNALHSLRDLSGRMLVLPKTIDDFLKALPEDLRSRFITQENEYIVYVQVAKEIYLEGNYERFAQVVNPITENYVGLPMVQHQLELAMEKDFWLSTLGSLALIILTLFIDFSSYRMRSAPFFVLLPLFVGYAWMLGGMGLLKVAFNLSNMVISPLLIGMGADNGIHLLHRYLERSGDLQRRQRLQRATETMAMPIVVASLATIASFGSLLFASTPGLQALGKSAVIGVGSVALCSLTLLPAVLAGRR